MKKTLIALAAVAATGAAFAQSSVTLSGKLAFAYEDATTQTTDGSVGGKTKGLGVTDGDLRVTATEDLGGGLKVTAYAEFLNRGRDQANTGRDAAITVSGGFGSVMIGSIEAGNGIIGLGGAGAPVIGLDNFVWALGTTPATVAAEATGVLDGGSNVNIIKYTAPSMGGFTFSVNATDSTATGGMQSTSATQDSTGVGVAYAAGPVAVSADYTDYGVNAATGATSIVGAPADSRTRISGSYDLGVVKLGAGYQTRDFVGVTGDSKQYILGISAPVGAFTVGYNYARHKIDLAGADFTATGHDFGVNYAMSKRTNVRVAYQRVKAEAAGVSLGTNGKRFQVRLMHSF